MKSFQCPVNKIALSADKANIAVMHGKRQTSYIQLENAIHHVQQHLKSSGIHKRSKVALICTDKYGFIVYYFALLRLGAPACLISTRLPKNNMINLLKELGCRYAYVSGNAPILNKDIAKIKGIRLSKSSLSLLSISRKTIYYAKDRVSNIMFTSGTSGHPKAVAHTIGNHYFSALGSNEHLPVKRDDQWLLSLPTYHVAGLSIIWRMFTAGGCVSIVQHNKSLSENLKQYKPTHISVVPTQLKELIHCAECIPKLKAMKVILIGGSSIEKGLIKACIKLKLPVHATYGLTEMSSQVATTKKIRSVADSQKAILLPYRKLKVTKDQRIFVKGETLFKGYYKNGRYIKPFTDKGWFETKDLGTIQGRSFLKIIGRMDKMFISGGENVYPEEIETVLNSMPAVEYSVVLSVQSATYGQRPIAFLKVNKHEKINRKIIVKFMKKRLEGFKIPDQLFYMPAGYKAGKFNSSRRDFLLLADLKQKRIRQIV